MKFRFSIPVIAATLTFSGCVLFGTQAQAKPPSPKPPSSQQTQFLCKSYGKGYGTFPKRGSRISNNPMITWQSNYFGPEYTPEQRCKSVSNKLTKVVSTNGGSMERLLLTTGRVGNYQVVCYINSTPESRCNNKNILFTLNGENAKNPGAALGKLLTFSRSGGGAAVRESAGEEEDVPVAVNLEEIVEETFAAGSYESAGGDEENAISPSSNESMGNHDSPEDSYESSPEVEPSNAPEAQNDEQGSF